MKVSVYNQEGKEIGTTTLPKEVFEVPMNADLVHQVLTIQTANQRQISAHTKDRAEVRGGGRKPWRQKGTGRARHGSIRSPLWRGGGVTFGPRKEKVFEKKVSKKMRRKALFMVLSEKAKNNLLVVIDKIQINPPDGGPKTKEMAKIINSLPCRKDSRLILTFGGRKIYLSARNIAKTGVLEVKNLNIVDLLNYKYALILKDGIREIEKIFLPKT